VQPSAAPTFIDSTRAGRSANWNSSDRVDQHDLFESDTGAGRDAAHFLDLTVIKILEYGQIFAHNLRQPALIDVEGFGLDAIMSDRARDFL
jgi:hypothetical protein